MKNRLWLSALVVATASTGCLNDERDEDDDVAEDVNMPAYEDGTDDDARVSTVSSNLATAKTYYVATSGNDDRGNGTNGSPWRTIGKAMRASLAPGDTVIVKSGTYNEVVNVNRGGSAAGYITLRSETPRGAKINATSKSFGVRIQANYVKIDGFDVYGANLSGISGGGVHHVDVTNNDSHDNGGAGVYFSKSEFLLVANNRLFRNAANSVTSGISIHIPENVSGDSRTTGFRFIVRKNVAYENVTKTAGHTDGNGIIFDDWMRRNETVANGGRLPAGVKPYTYPGLIEQNVVYGNGATGIRVYATDNITVRNNLAYFNNKDPHPVRQNSMWNGELQNSSGSNNTWVNNIGVAEVRNKSYGGISSVEFKDKPSRGLVWANNLTYTVGRPGDRSVNARGGAGVSVPANNGNKLGVDPRFVNAPSNFRLGAQSPAIDAGTLRHGAPLTSTDFLGARRVVGSAIDIGPHERQ